MDESATPEQEWHDFCSLEEIPDVGVLTGKQGGVSLLVYRNGPDVTCVPNYCPHRGWPFDGAEVRAGVLTCPYHGYEFRLDTGQCLSSPSLPLDMYPVRVRDGRVEVRLKSRSRAQQLKWNINGVNTNACCVRGRVRQRAEKRPYFAP